MMKKCLCLIIYTIAFLSCTSKDGDWEPMEWEVDTSAYLKKDHIAVPESGGTYTLFCNNYATFWLSSVFEDGVQIETDSTVGSAAKGMWSSIEIRKKAEYNIKLYAKKRETHSTEVAGRKPLRHCRIEGEKKYAE